MDRELTDSERRIRSNIRNACVGASREQIQAEIQHRLRQGRGFEANCFREWLSELAAEEAEAGTPKAPPKTLIYVSITFSGLQWEGVGPTVSDAIAKSNVYSAATTTEEQMVLTTAIGGAAADWENRSVGAAARNEGRYRTEVKIWDKVNPEWILWACNPKHTGASDLACRIVRDTFLSLDGFEPIRKNNSDVLGFAAELARKIDTSLDNATEDAVRVANDILDDMADDAMTDE